MGLLLHPNRLSIGKAIALTKYRLKEQGQNFIPADITFRRYAKWFKDIKFDNQTLNQIKGMSKKYSDFADLFYCDLFNSNQNIVFDYLFISSHKPV